MSWAHFQEHYHHYPELGFSLDLSRLPLPAAFTAAMEAPMQEAFAAMRALEGGAIANPDEGRRVGHYWLRSPALAPTPEIRA
jgi:glucose-6-phosphate isomerase